MSGDLPTGWRWAKLGDVCVQDRVAIGPDDSEYQATPYVGLEHVESNTGRILIALDESPPTETKSSNFCFTPKHVLYGKLRPYLNKVALPSIAGRCTTEMIPLLPNEVNREWLAWLLRRQETVDYAMAGKTGSRMPRTSMRDLMRMDVALPPLEEQRRIADKMNLVEHARSVAAAQLTSIDELTTAMLREIFPPSPSAEVPRGWRWVKLGDVCKISIGRTPRRAELEHWGGNQPWATIADITASDGIVSRTKESLTDSGAAVCAGRLLSKGTLMFSFKLSIGQMAFAGCDLYTNEAIAGLIPNEAKVVDTEFLKHALSVADFDALSGHAVKGKTLNRKSIAQIDLPLPGLEDQRRIVDRMTSVAKGRSAANAQLAAIVELEKTLLQDSFVDPPKADSGTG